VVKQGSDNIYFFKETAVRFPRLWDEKQGSYEQKLIMEGNERDPASAFG